MLKKANVLILDEPTNHLDIYSKEVLESALMDFEGTLLFISHDRYFLNKLAERVLELTPEGIRHFLGNFDDVVEKKKEMEELREEPLREEQNKASSAAGTAGKTEDAPTSYEERKKARREERNRQRRAGELEAKIEQLEERMREIEREIALPEISRDYVKLQEKNDELESIRQALEQAYEEWEALL